MNEDEPKFEPVDEFELRKRGGKWLAAARSWLQWRRTTKGVSGDQIKWGDHNALFEVSALEVEELAARITAAALNEHGDSEAQIEHLRRKRLEAEINASELAERVKRLEGLVQRVLDAEGAGTTAYPTAEDAGTFYRALQDLRLAMPKPAPQAIDLMEDLRKSLKR